ncbi:MAG: hypothetical protein AAF125_28210 [Chloroflexota bacterium]
MQPHINNPELRRIFVVAQLLLASQLEQQASEAEANTPDESNNADPKGENNNAQES